MWPSPTSPESTNSSVVSVGVIGTNVISPVLSQVQLPSSGTDDGTGIGTGDQLSVRAGFWPLSLPSDDQWNHLYPG